MTRFDPTMQNETGEKSMFNFCRFAKIPFLCHDIALSPENATVSQKRLFSQKKGYVLRKKARLFSQKKGYVPRKKDVFPENNEVVSQKKSLFSQKKRFLPRKEVIFQEEDVMTMMTLYLNRVRNYS